MQDNASQRHNVSPSSSKVSTPAGSEAECESTGCCTHSQVYHTPCMGDAAGRLGKRTQLGLFIGCLVVEQGLEH